MTSTIYSPAHQSPYSSVQGEGAKQHQVDARQTVALRPVPEVPGLTGDGVDQQRDGEADSYCIHGYYQMVVDSVTVTEIHTDGKRSVWSMGNTDLI